MHHVYFSFWCLTFSYFDIYGKSMLGGKKYQLFWNQACSSLITVIILQNRSEIMADRPCPCLRHLFRGSTNSTQPLWCGKAQVSIMTLSRNDSFTFWHFPSPAWIFTRCEAFAKLYCRHLPPKPSKRLAHSEASCGTERGAEDQSLLLIL